LAWLISSFSPLLSSPLLFFHGPRYVLPWDPLHLCFATPAYHDIHHWGKGIRYNFAQPFFTIWDEVGGTIYPYSLDELMSEKGGQEGEKEENEGKMKYE